MKAKDGSNGESGDCIRLRSQEGDFLCLHKVPGYPRVQEGNWDEETVCRGMRGSKLTSRLIGHRNDAFEAGKALSMSVTVTAVIYLALCRTSRCIRHWSVRNIIIYFFLILPFLCHPPLRYARNTHTFPASLISIPQPATAFRVSSWISSPRIRSWWQVHTKEEGAQDDENERAEERERDADTHQQRKHGTKLLQAGEYGRCDFGRCPGAAANTSSVSTIACLATTYSPTPLTKIKIKNFDS